MTERRRLKFGIVLTPTSGAGDPVHRQLAEHGEVVDLVRDLGFDLLITGQHFASPELRFLQPIPYLAALAQRTGSMRLVTGVLLLPLLHPLVVAEEMATLDALTGGGRTVMGAGIGYAPREFDIFGVDRSRRATRMRESVEVIRRLWSGESVTHRGEHFDLRDVRSSAVPASSAGIPVWVGAQAPPSVRRAAEIADAWYCPPFPSHRQLIDLSKLHDVRRAELGKPAPTDFPVRREVFVADTVERARQLAAEATRARYDTYRDWGLDLDGDSDDDWMDSRIIAGDPPLVVDRLCQLVDAIPMTHLVLRAHWVGQRHVDSMRHLERLGSDVLTHLD